MVVKDYRQKQGVDYPEVFAPIAHLEKIQLVISLAAKKMGIFQLDVKSIFLHGELSEEVFIEKLPRYVKNGVEQKVYVRLYTD